VADKFDPLVIDAMFERARSDPRSAREIAGLAPDALDRALFNTHHAMFTNMTELPPELRGPEPVAPVDPHFSGFLQATSTADPRDAVTAEALRHLPGEPGRPGAMVPTGELPATVPTQSMVERMDAERALREGRDLSIKQWRLLPRQVQKWLATSGYTPPAEGPWNKDQRGWRRFKTQLLGAAGGLLGSATEAARSVLNMEGQGPALLGPELPMLLDGQVIGRQELAAAERPQWLETLLEAPETAAKVVGPPKNKTEVMIDFSARLARLIGEVILLRRVAGAAGAVVKSSLQPIVRSGRLAGFVGWLAEIGVFGVPEQYRRVVTGQTTPGQAAKEVGTAGVGLLKEVPIGVFEFVKLMGQKDDSLEAFEKKVHAIEPAAHLFVLATGTRALRRIVGEKRQAGPAAKAEAIEDPAWISEQGKGALDRAGARRLEKATQQQMEEMAAVKPADVKPLPLIEKPVVEPAAQSSVSPPAAGERGQKVQRALLGVAAGPQRAELPASLAGLKNRSMIDRVLHHRWEAVQPSVDSAELLTVSNASTGVMGAKPLREAVAPIISRPPVTGGGQRVLLKSLDEVRAVEKLLAKVRKSKRVPDDLRKAEVRRVGKQVRNARQMLSAGLDSQGVFEEAQAELTKLTGPGSPEQQRAGEPEAITQKQPWELSLGEWRARPSLRPEGYSSMQHWKHGGRRARDVDAAIDAGHYLFIRESVRQGKPVPTEVLAEYPDLAKPTKQQAVKPKPAVAEGKPALDRQRAGRIETVTGAEAIPAARVGKQTTVYDRSQRQYPVKYAAVPLSELVASHDQYLRTRSDYPELLQARDRSSQASREQIETMAGDLKPELLLGEHMDATSGPPVVWRDPPTGRLLVVAGNGRAIAMQAAPAEARGRYRAALGRRAAELGIDEVPADAVLVRLLEVPDLETAGKLAGASQESMSLAQTRLERAVGRAREVGLRDVGELPRFTVDEPITRETVGAFLANNPTLRSWLQQRVGPQRWRQIESQPESAAELVNDLFASTLPKEVHSIGSEATPEVESMFEALAGPVASLRAEIKAGRTKGQYDLFEEVADAAGLFRLLRSRRTSIGKLLDKLDETAETPTLGSGFEDVLSDISREGVAVGVALARAASHKAPAGEILAKARAFSRRALQESTETSLFGDQATPLELIFETFRLGNDRQAIERLKALGGEPGGSTASGPPGEPAGPQPITGRRSLREALVGQFNLDREQAMAVSHVAQARAEAWGASTGRPASEWYSSRIAGVERGEGKPRGAVEFLADGRAVIRALGRADVSTGLHELAHVFRRELSGTDLLVAERWAGVKQGRWTRAAEEKFGRAFERYVRQGEAPIKRLRPAFERFRRWLSAIYQRLSGSSIDVKVSPAMRDVFNRLLRAGDEPIESVRRDARAAVTDRLAILNERIGEIQELRGTDAAAYDRRKGELGDLRAEREDLRTEDLLYQLDEMDPHWLDELTHKDKLSIVEEVKRAAERLGKPTPQRLAKLGRKLYRFVFDTMQLQPALTVRKKHGAAAEATVMRGFHQPEAEMLGWDQSKAVAGLDLTFEQLGKTLDRSYTKQQLRNFNLLRQTPQTTEGRGVQSQVAGQLPAGLKTGGVFEAVQQIADQNYWMLHRLLEGDVGYVKDYFYGLYKNPAQVEKFLDHYRTTTRYLKDKKFPSYADAYAFGLRLKDENPVANLRSEASAIWRMAALKELRDELLRTGEGRFIVEERSAPIVSERAHWEKIDDPVFKGYRIEPDLAKLIRNLASANKISQSKTGRTFRAINNSVRSIKFIGSGFHLLVVGKQSIADSGLLGFLNPRKWPGLGRQTLARGFRENDPIFKTAEYTEYIRNGGGHHYSIESDAQRAVQRVLTSKQYGPLWRAARVPLRLTLGLPNGFVRWMFQSYIPKLKYDKYLQEVAALEKRAGRKASAADHQAIIREGQNFYGEMNERLFGRSGTATSILRFFFLAPGFREGNYRTMAKALLQKSAKRSRRNIPQSLLLSGILASVGTRIMTGQWPDVPHSLDELRDLFKIKTPWKDHRGRTIYIDMLTYDRDYWDELVVPAWKLLTGKPLEAAEELVGTFIKTIGGMKSPTLAICTDIARLSMGQPIVDYFRRPIFYEHDPPLTKLAKWAQHAWVQAEPISVGVAKRMVKRKTHPAVAVLAAAAGLRPSLSEKDRKVAKVVRDVFSLRDEQEELYYKLGKMSRPRAAIEKYNKIVDRILADRELPDDLRDDLEKRPLKIDVDRLLGNKVMAFTAGGADADKQQRAFDYLRNFGVDLPAAVELLGGYRVPVGGRIGLLLAKDGKRPQRAIHPKTHFLRLQTLHARWAEHAKRRQAG